MDYPRIKGIAPGIDGFLEEWFSPAPHIIAYTSGSTGTPKEIKLLKADMELSAMTTCRFFNIDANSVLGLPLSVGYIAGKMMVVRAIVSGAALWVEAPSSRPFADFTGRIDLAAIVPAQVDGLLETGSRLSVANLIVGGAPLSLQSEMKLMGHGINGYATYGMTETCSNVALRPLGKSRYIANDGFVFSKDERGCLVIRNSGMSFGTVVTNDVVDLVSETEFEWRGRIDNVINTGGVKVFPEDIEAKIGNMLPEGHFIITSRPHSKWGEQVILKYEKQYCNPGKDIRDAVEALLKPYERPGEWLGVESLDRTDNGKLRR